MRDSQIQCKDQRTPVYKSRHGNSFPSGSSSELYCHSVPYCLVITFVFHSCFPMYSVNSSVSLCILGIKMCSWATFRPLGYRQRAQYKNNRTWSHLSKQWDWEFFTAVCSENFVGATTVCQGRAWADVISQLVPVSLDSKPRQMEWQSCSGFPT